MNGRERHRIIITLDVKIASQALVGFRHRDAGPSGVSYRSLGRSHTDVSLDSRLQGRIVEWPSVCLCVYSSSISRAPVSPFDGG